MPYLGFLVRTGAGVTVDPKKVKALLQAIPEKLTTVTSVKSLLGATSYYRKYIPDYAAITEPLLRLIKGRRKRDNIVWC